MAGSSAYPEDISISHGEGCTPVRLVCYDRGWSGTHLPTIVWVKGLLRDPSAALAGSLQDDNGSFDAASREESPMHATPASRVEQWDNCEEHRNLYTGSIPGTLYSSSTLMRLS